MCECLCVCVCVCVCARACACVCAAFQQPCGRDSDRSTILTVIASLSLPVAASVTVADMGTAVAVAVAAAVCFRLWVLGRGPGRCGLTATRRHSPSGPLVAGRQQRDAAAPPPPSPRLLRGVMTPIVCGHSPRSPQPSQVVMTMKAVTVVNPGVLRDIIFQGSTGLF